MKPDTLRLRLLGAPDRRLLLVGEAAHILVLTDGESSPRLVTSDLSFDDLSLAERRRALLAAIERYPRPCARVSIDVIEQITGAIEYGDVVANQHGRRVGELTARLARALGLGADEVGLLSRAAALHDVGKIGIPHALLRKPARLTEAEMRVMRTHTTIGAHILGGSEDPALQLAALIALFHHERWDGTGYPHQAAGETIPFAGRIVAVADAFDALTTDRPYRSACAMAYAIDEITSQRGTKFDADIVDALASIAGDLQHAVRSSSPASLSYRSIA